MEMPLVFLALPFLFAVACYGEVRAHRIPNWLTLGGIVLGLGSAFITGWFPGLWDSLLGLAIAGGVFLPFCLLGVVGGGDMKLLAATGAIVGYPLVLRVLTGTCIAGGLLAVGIMAWHGVLLSMLSNAFRIMVGMPRKGRGLRNPPMVPYGIAIAAGTLYAVFIQTY